MTAAVMPLARNADQMRDLLEDMALGRGIRGDRKVLATISALVDGHTRESLTAAWDEFRQTVRAREALATGTRSWAEFYEPRDCAGHDHAIDLKTTEVDDAYRTLRYGPKDGAR